MGTDERRTPDRPVPGQPVPDQPVPDRAAPDQAARRLAAALPAANVTVVADLGALLPGLRVDRRPLPVLAAADVPLPAVADGALAALAPDPAPVALLGYATGSYLGGPGWDAALARAVADRTGGALVTAADAAVRMLRATGARTVAVVSPYPAAVNAAARRYLDDSGLRVVAVEGSPPDGSASRLDRDQVLAMVGLVAGVEADAVLLSCTALRTLDVLPAAADLLGRPVVSSNLASAWCIARLTGVAGTPPEGAPWPA